MVLMCLVPVCRMHDRDGSGTISFDEFQSLHQFIVNTQVSPCLG
jgi:hypothetical protein